MQIKTNTSMYWCFPKSFTCNLRIYVYDLWNVHKSFLTYDKTMWHVTIQVGASWSNNMWPVLYVQKPNSFHLWPIHISLWRVTCINKIVTSAPKICNLVHLNIWLVTYTHRYVTYDIYIQLCVLWLVYSSMRPVTYKYLTRDMCT